MSAGYGFVEVIFVFGIALALALWELVRIRREVRKSRDREAGEPPDDLRPR